MKTQHPELIVEYTDPLEGFKGWLVIESLGHRLAAGGLRVQKGLTCEVVQRLANTMTQKMRIAGIRADGAKSGIDYDPSSPGKPEALLRFLRAIQPYIEHRYSVGPDLNTTMPELDAICSGLGIFSIKTAIAKHQGLSPEAFQERVALLKQPLGHATLGRLRAGAGVASSCLAVLDFLKIPAQQARVVIQGFGGLATGAAFFLHQAGVAIIGLADCDKSLIQSEGQGLDIPDLLARSCADCQSKGLIPTGYSKGVYGPRQAIYALPCDVFIPAAIEKAIDQQQAAAMQVQAVVSGANLAVTDAAEALLFQRDILLIPDMLAGCGGSLSMDGLFGPDKLPTVQEVLHHVDQRTRTIVCQLLQRSRQDHISQREAALRLCAETPLYPNTRPYGPI
jgi:glutamate dehydrogenase/leucine dehydrogenase